MREGARGASSSVTWHTRGCWGVIVGDVARERVAAVSSSSLVMWHVRGWRRCRRRRW
jgi:hypothetical protein